MNIKQKSNSYSGPSVVFLYFSEFFTNYVFVAVKNELNNESYTHFSFMLKSNYSERYETDMTFIKGE